MLDAHAFELLGLTPRDVDRFSFRELWVMFAAAKRRDLNRWQHTLAIAQAIQNWGGPRGKEWRPKPLSAMFELSQGRGHRMTNEQMAATLHAHSTRKVD